MYTAYFGFNSKPFKPKDSKDYYRNANFDAACADILDGIRERRGFILLTGDAGVGKTLVLRRCMAEADDIKFVRLVNANLDFPDILNYLCSSLELPVEGLDAEQRKRLLLDTLAQGARRNRATALLVDDAQHLPDEVLLQLREFVETPPIPGQRLQVVLVGLPEIAGKLDRPELRPLRDSIRVRCRLERLSEFETGLFIDHQFKVAGHPGGLLSPAAIERIGLYCKGVPRAIAILCDTVLLFASLQSEHDIGPDLVDEAAQSCFLGEQSKLVVGAPAKPPAIPPLDALPAADGADFDLDLSEFEFSFDFDEKTMRAKSAKGEEAPSVESTFRSGRSPEFAPAAEPASRLEVADWALPVEAFDAEEAGQATELVDTVALSSRDKPTLVTPPPVSARRRTASPQPRRTSPSSSSTDPGRWAGPRPSRSGSSGAERISGPNRCARPTASPTDARRRRPRSKGRSPSSNRSRAQWEHRARRPLTNSPMKPGSDPPRSFSRRRATFPPARRRSGSNPGAASRSSTSGI